MSGSNVDNYTAAILGVPKSGKSTLLWALCCALPCVWLFDSTGSGHAVPVGGLRLRPDPRAKRDESRGGRYYADVEAVAQAVAQQDETTLAIDEGNLCVRRGQQGPDAVGELIHEGRHMPYGKPTGVGCIVVARRPSEMPPHWLGAVRHLFVFRLTNPRDLDWARQSGFPTSAGLNVATLRRGQFFHLNVEAGEAPHLHTHALDGAC